MHRIVFSGNRARKERFPDHWPEEEKVFSAGRALVRKPGSVRLASDMLGDFVTGEDGGSDLESLFLTVPQLSDTRCLLDLLGVGNRELWDLVVARLSHMPLNAATVNRLGVIWEDTRLYREGLGIEEPPAEWRGRWWFPAPWDKRVVDGFLHPERVRPGRLQATVLDWLQTPEVFADLSVYGLLRLAHHHPRMWRRAAELGMQYETYLLDVLVGNGRVRARWGKELEFLLPLINFGQAINLGSGPVILDIWDDVVWKRWVRDKCRYVKPREVRGLVDRFPDLLLPALLGRVEKERAEESQGDSSEVDGSDDSGGVEQWPDPTGAWL